MSNYELKDISGNMAKVHGMRKAATVNYKEHFTENLDIANALENIDANNGHLVTPYARTPFCEATDTVNVINMFILKHAVGQKAQRKGISNKLKEFIDSVDGKIEVTSQVASFIRSINRDLELSELRLLETFYFHTGISLKGVKYCFPNIHTVIYKNDIWTDTSADIQTETLLDIPDCHALILGLPKDGGSHNGLYFNDEADMENISVNYVFKNGCLVILDK